MSGGVSRRRQWPTEADPPAMPAGGEGEGWVPARLPWARDGRMHSLHYPMNAFSLAMRHPLARSPIPAH